jgi:DNA-binding CsgD family transcriptional regulator
VLAAMVGDRETALLRVQAARAEQPGLPRALCAWALALLDLVAGRPRPAAARLGAIVGAPPGLGDPVIQVAATPHLIEAVARAGGAGPPAATAEFARWAVATGRPDWLALRDRCAALSTGDESAADDLFRTALRRHRAGSDDFARAHTQLLYGRELRRRRRPAAAREHLRDAAETFRRLAAGPWAVQAEMELRAAGDTPEVRPGTDALTAQQDHIAHLVADGATNREVAQQLLLSPRTVDHHLRNVYARLGVRSRTELARVLTARDVSR